MPKYDPLTQIDPLKPQTDGTGVITSYVRLVEEVMQQKASNQPLSQL